MHRKGIHNSVPPLLQQQGGEGSPISQNVVLDVSAL